MQAGEERRLVARERIAALGDFGAHDGEELHVVVDVVRVQQDLREHLVRVEEVVHIGARVIGAGQAAARGQQRRRVARVPLVAQVDLRA